MFTYICLGSNDLARSARFYDAALGALGLKRCDTPGEASWDGWLGWGTYKDQGATEGAPGLRTQYNPDFYAAYVRDPDGNKLAAVCRGYTEPCGTRVSGRPPV